MQMNMATEQPRILPPLRDDLALLAGPPTAAGAPTYTVHDPAAGRYYRIGWLQFEILSVWQAGQTAADIVTAIKRKPFMQVDENDVTAVADFLAANNLIVRSDAASVQSLAMRAQSQSGPFKWLLKNYLYLKIPLVRPDALLSRITPHLGFLFSARFYAVIFVLLIAAVFVVVRQWDRWTADFALIKTPQGILLTAAVLLVSKIIHECGHGIAAKRYGCRVPRMGVALILLWPVLWTDTTDAWRITDRKKRLIIDSAGVIAELMLAIAATLLWAAAPEGMFKTAMHILSGVAWVMTLAVNVNPFMRFDGYYILSDGKDIPNLQPRSFAYTRWWLRARVLDSSEAPPEQQDRATARFMIVYALACWLYRLILFTGIALMVYAYFFKALGIFLFIVEIWYFILRPVAMELPAWRRALSGRTTPPYLAAILIAVLSAVLISALPIHRGVNAHGYVRAPDEYLLEVPIPAQVTSLSLASGQSVKAGDVLAVLTAPDLAMQGALADAQARALYRQYEQQAVGTTTYHDAALSYGEALTRRAESLGFQTSQEKLTLRAKADGVLRDVPPDVRVGDWLPARQSLGILVPQGMRIDAFVPEQTLARLHKGQSATVRMASMGGVDDRVFKVVYVGAVPVRDLPYAEMAAQHGGPIDMLPQTQAERRYVPAEPLFLVTLQAREGDSALERAGPVDVRITADAHSPLVALLRHVFSVLIRESGF